MKRQFLTAILPFSSLTMWILKNFHSYLRICGYSNFEIFSLAVGTNKTTSSGWMIAKDETKPRDETIENIRGYQTFILWKSTNTSLYNIQKLEVTVHARARMHSHVYTRSSSNLDPNIQLTFCDGDCIFLLFHTLPLLGETDLLSTSRKTYFLGYPDEVEIKGIAEIKGVSKIKGGQWRKIAEVWCPQHALVVTSRVCSSHPSFVLRFSQSSNLPPKVSRKSFSVKLECMILFQHRGMITYVVYT